jgi:hypothetical protein
MAFTAKTLLDIIFFTLDAVSSLFPGILHVFSGSTPRMYVICMRCVLFRISYFIPVYLAFFCALSGASAIIIYPETITININLPVMRVPLRQTLAEATRSLCHPQAFKAMKKYHVIAIRMAFLLYCHDDAAPPPLRSLHSSRLALSIWII